MPTAAPDDSDRLHALRALAIVGTDPEPHFDAVCHIARALFQVPIALVSLVEEDRQWFKARCGLSSEGTPREIAFCGHTILSDEVLVVEDATRDPRFAANPLVTGEPRIRSYAGAPLVLQPGIRVGTVCVIDTSPRVFSDEQKRQLRSLADIVVAHLRLQAARRASEEEEVRRRSAERALAERVAGMETMLRAQQLAEKAASIGHWRILPEGPSVHWSEGLARIFGRPLPEGGAIPLDEHLAFYHPDDGPGVRARIEAAFSGEMPHAGGYQGRARVVRPDGTLRHVIIQGAPETADPTPAALYGVVLDVTDMVLREEQAQEAGRVLSATLERMDQGLVMLGPDRRVRLLNARAQDLLGLPDTVLYLGASFDDIRAFQHARGEFARAADPTEESAAIGDAPVLPPTYELLLTDGTTLEVHGVHLQDGSLIYTFADITMRRSSERAVRDSERRYRLLAENTTDIIIWCGLDTTRRYVSPAVRAILGYAPESLVGTRPLDFVHPDEARDYNRLLEDLTLGRTEQVRTCQRYRHQDGSWVWLEISFNLTHDPVTGQPDGYVAALRDISDRKVIEDSLRHSEERLALALDSGSDGLWDWDLASGTIWFSDRWHEMLGYERGEIEADVAFWHRLVHPEDVTDARNLMRAHMAGELPVYQCEFRLLRKDGSYLWVLVRGKAERRDADGRALRIVGTQIDISRRKKAELALSGSEARYRALTDALPQLVWIFSVETGEATYVNQQFERYYGPIGTTRAARMACNHPDDAARMEQAWQEARRAGGPYRIEGRLRRQDGAYRWHKLVALPIQQDGRVVGMLATALDIDEIVAARQELEETTNLLRIAQEAAGAGTWEHDLAARVVTVSPEAARLYGVETDKSLRWCEADWMGLLAPGDAPAGMAVARQAIEDRTSFSVELRCPQADGTVRWLGATGRALYDEQGRATRLIGLNKDITARKVAEHLLLEAKSAAEAARAQAEQASAAKSDFLATMSHEIRTPLNGVLGYTDLLLEELAAGTRAWRYAERIQGAGSSLLTVVNDILDFSKIEAGQVALAAEPFAPGHVAQQALSIVRASADRKHVELGVEVAPDVPTYVVGDQDRLRQVLLNLLNNAVKFTAHGSVTLRVSCGDRADGRARLRFSVEDTGIGIPASKQHLLFERFSQVDGSVQREFGGTGLGLAICKRLVELMGGRIGVASEPDKGSTFWFEVSLEVTAPAAEPVASSAGPVRKGRRLLLVEDVPLNQELAVTVLQAAGHDVDVADSGPDAIRKVREESYDLVLMDVQMPGMDGMTATRHIRALDHAAASVPILAMTANVLPQQVAACREAGMNDHVGKPFKREALLAAIERWTSHCEPAPPRRRSVLDRDVYADAAAALGHERLHHLLGTLADELGSRFGDAGGMPDRETLEHDAHAMIAASGTLGFAELAQLCREVEVACQEGRSYEAGLNRLRSLSADVVAEITALRAA
jgi:PAS domain S-box-containing protein